MNQSFCHRAIQALRIPDGQLPILLDTLETFPNPTSVDSLKAIAIKCTKRAAENMIRQKCLSRMRIAILRGVSEGGEIEFTEEAGETYLAKPEKDFQISQ